MLRNPSFYIINIFLLLFLSCDRDKDSLAPETPEEAKFYYAGYKFNTTFTSSSRWAVVAINDSIVQLSPINRSDAVAVFNNGQDTYVAGYQHNGTENKRISLWKNGTISYLSAAATNNNATVVYEDQGKVYVAGTEYINNLPYQRLWINGQLEVNSGALAFSGIRAITTHNGKYYLAGQFAQATATWYDDSMKTINVAPSEATFIKVENSDVITSGYGGVNANQDAIKVWKGNQEIFTHSVGERIYTALSTIVGNDYYFVTLGYSGNLSTAKVYKNNTLLYELAPGKNVEATAIQVYQNKVYVLGNLIVNGKSTPTLWTDGTPKSLFPEESNIFLNHFQIR